MRKPSTTPSAAAAIAALRKAGLTDRLAGKVPGGDIRVLLTYAAESERAVEVLAARFPAATVRAEDPLTVRISVAGHTAEPQWASGGPGKSAYTDYRWECGCGHRYGNATPKDGDVGAQHAAHLRSVAS